MRNSTVRKVIEKWNMIAEPPTSVEIRKRVDALHVELRSFHEVADASHILKTYAEMAYNIIGWLWRQKIISIDDVEDNRENFQLGPTHMDLLMSFIEDFVGGDTLDKKVNILIGEDGK